MNRDDIFHQDTQLRVHFMGIGGCSMSRLATVLHKRGYRVSGCDAADTATCQRLRALGMDIVTGHDPAHADQCDLLIYTAAIAPDHSELQHARALGITMMDRASLLGQLMRQYEHAIAVAGTHGKTTTTSMISEIFVKANLSPTIHIGGEVATLDTIDIPSQSEIFITEACEYVDSFLKLNPTIAIINNIEEDHLDYFRDLTHIQQSFQRFVDLLGDEGMCIGNGDDPQVAKLFASSHCRQLTFGLHPSYDYAASDIQWDAQGCASFSLLCKDQPGGIVQLSVPGLYNVYNALAAIAAAQCFDIPIDLCAEALRAFTGAARRFDQIGHYSSMPVILDYAHHPTEIKNLLAAAKGYTHGKVLCVFQPHTYTRTAKLFDRFVEAFDQADTLFITDIYAAREKNQGQVHASVLARAIDGRLPCQYIADIHMLPDLLKKAGSPGDLILIVGAGNIDQFGRWLVTPA